MSMIMLQKKAKEIWKKEEKRLEKISKNIGMDQETCEM